MRAYVVQRGEDLASIGARLGFDPEAVWSLPENRELRDLRRDPGVLAPGDVLRVPEPESATLPLTAGADNPFEAEVPSLRMHLALRSGGVIPLANEPYRVEGLARPLTGTTDGDGVADFRLPAHVREVRVVVVRTGVSTVLRIGELDPVEERTGLEQRLYRLGLLREEPSGERSIDDDLLARALRRFQRTRGLEVTGEADEATRRALVEEHGS